MLCDHQSPGLWVNKHEQARQPHVRPAADMDGCSGGVVLGAMLAQGMAPSSAAIVSQLAVQQAGSGQAMANNGSGATYLLASLPCK